MSKLFFVLSLAGELTTFSYAPPAVFHRFGAQEPPAGLVQILNRITAGQKLALGVDFIVQYCQRSQRRP